MPRRGRLFGRDFSGGEIVEAAAGVDEAVDDELVVGAAVGGVDAVAGDVFAEAGEGVVFVVEGFDDDFLELFGLDAGGEEGGDPAFVGGVAATGGFGGGVEGAEVSSGGDVADGLLVLF